MTPAELLTRLDEIQAELGDLRAQGDAILARLRALGDLVRLAA
jgi:hypothetical protein